MQRPLTESSRRRDRREIRRIARRTARMVLAILVLLAALISILAFSLGSEMWPAWLIQERRTFIGLLGLGFLGLMLWAPVIVAADSDPQPFASPGDRPQG